MIYNGGAEFVHHAFNVALHGRISHDKYMLRAENGTGHIDVDHQTMLFKLCLVCGNIRFATEKALFL